MDLELILCLLVAHGHLRGQSEMHIGRVSIHTIAKKVSRHSGRVSETLVHGNETVSSLSLSLSLSFILSPLSLLSSLT